MQPIFGKISTFYDEDSLFVESAHMSRGTVFEVCSLLVVPVDMCNGLGSSTAAGRVAPVQYKANTVDCRAAL